MVTGVQRERERERERVCGHDMVTGATEQIGNCHDMTGVHEEVTYCSPSTSSGSEEKAKEKPFYQSPGIPQLEHPCDDRSRPNFVSPSAVGK